MKYTVLIEIYYNRALHLPKSIASRLYSLGGGNAFGRPILMMA